MNNKPEPTTGDADLKQPEQKSSAIVWLWFPWVMALIVLCFFCAIWVLR